MVQVIGPGGQRGPTTGQRLTAGLGNALQIGQQFMQQNQQKQAMEKAGFGDLAGLPPELQKVALAEMLRSQGKEKLLGQKQQLLQGLFGGQGQPQSGMGQQLAAGEPEQPPMAQGFDPTHIPDEAIAEAAAIDPTLANTLRGLKDTALRDKRAVQKQALSEKKFEHAQQEAKRAEHQRQVEKSYAANQDFIDTTTQQYRAFETETKPRLQQMLAINDEDLIGPTAASFLEKMGVPLGALERPGSEVYNKLSQDLLKGLPETYGNRILKVEVDNFLKTIPTLQNSPTGRRIIAANMLKLGEMKAAYYNEMRKMQKSALESDQPLSKDFEQSVLDNVMPHINQLNREFVQLSEIQGVPPGTVPFYNPQGGISFVPEDPKTMQWAIENGGKRVW